MIQQIVRHTKNATTGLTSQFDKAKARLEMVEAAVKDKQSRQAAIEAYLETLKEQDTWWRDLSLRSGVDC